MALHEGIHGAWAMGDPAEAAAVATRLGGTHHGAVVAIERPGPVDAALVDAVQAAVREARAGDVRIVQGDEVVWAAHDGPAPEAVGAMEVVSVEAFPRKRVQRLVLGAKGLVLAVSLGSEARVVDTVAGKAKGRKPVPAGTFPVGFAGKDVLVAGPGKVRRLSPTGKVAWTAAVGLRHGAYGACVTGDGRHAVVYGLGTEGLWRVAVADGGVERLADAVEASALLPRGGGEVLCACDADGTQVVDAFDVASGTRTQRMVLGPFDAKARVRVVAVGDGVVAVAWREAVALATDGDVVAWLPAGATNVRALSFDDAGRLHVFDHSWRLRTFDVADPSVPKLLSDGFLPGHGEARHRTSPQAGDVTAAGRWLAFQSARRRVHLVDLVARCEHGVFASPDRVEAMALDASGRVVIGTDRGGLVVGHADRVGAPVAVDPPQRVVEAPRDPVPARPQAAPVGASPATAGSMVPRTLPRDLPASPRPAPLPKAPPTDASQALAARLAPHWAGPSAAGRKATKGLWAEPGVGDALPGALATAAKGAVGTTVTWVGDHVFTDLADPEAFYRGLLALAHPKWTAWALRHAHRAGQRAVLAQVALPYVAFPSLLAAWPHDLLDAVRFGGLPDATWKPAVRPLLAHPDPSLREAVHRALHGDRAPVPPSPRWWGLCASEAEALDAVGLDLSAFDPDAPVVWPTFFDVQEVERPEAVPEGARPAPVAWQVYEGLKGRSDRFRGPFRRLKKQELTLQRGNVNLWVEARGARLAIIGLLEPMQWFVAVDLMNDPGHGRVDVWAIPHDAYDEAHRVGTLADAFGKMKRVR